MQNPNPRQGEPAPSIVNASVIVSLLPSHPTSLLQLIEELLAMRVQVGSHPDDSLVLSAVRVAIDKVNQGVEQFAMAVGVEYGSIRFRVGPGDAVQLQLQIVIENVEASYFGDLLY